MTELGRRVPTTWTHVERYPLAALPEAPRGIPCVLGINWYSAFDHPTKDAAGRYWIGRTGNLGSIRGGHAIMVKSVQPDADTWWSWYNQNPFGGACVGFSCSRMMSHYNRVKYAAEWLYYEAQKVDYWDGGAYPGASPYYEGTAISSACDVLRAQGHKMRTWGAPRMSAGIVANRWITSVDEVHRTIALPLADKLGAVPLLNSWGVSYPRLVWLPDAVLERLLQEDGECAVVTDR